MAGFAGSYGPFTLAQTAVPGGAVAIGTRSHPAESPKGELCSVVLGERVQNLARARMHEDVGHLGVKIATRRYGDKMILRWHGCPSQPRDRSDLVGREKL